MQPSIPLALICILGTALSASANLITNGDFESPPVANLINGFDTYTGGQNFDGWKVGGHSIDIVSDQAGAWVSWKAASGHQSVDLNGMGAGSITQDIPTIPLQAYELTFALAGNVASAPWIVTMEFLWHNQVVDVVSFQTQYNRNDPGWTYLSYLLTAETDLARLTFSSLNYSTGGAIIDNVSLNPIGMEHVPDSSSPWWAASLLLPLACHSLTRASSVQSRRAQN